MISKINICIIPKIKHIPVHCKLHTLVASHCQSFLPVSHKPYIYMSSADLTEYQKKLIFRLTVEFQ